MARSGAGNRFVLPGALIVEATTAIALTLGLRLIMGPAFMGYDATWSLVWGEQVLHGGLPSYDLPAAPTPHPLSNVIATVAALPVPQASLALLAGLSWVSAAALAWGVVRLVAPLFGRSAGLLAAAIVMTRAPIGLLGTQAFVDLPFLALVIWAAALELDERDRAVRVVALLVLAGLLRPEAWLLAAGYGVLVLRRRGRAGWPLALTLVAAPVVWALIDLIVTGDPLHSLHGTQSLAADLDRPRGLGTALETVLRRLQHAMQGPAAVAAIAGIATALRWRRRAVSVPLALVVFGLATYLCLGLADLPLLERYLLLPAIVLSAFAAWAVLGWRTLPLGSRARRTAAVAAAGAAGLLLIGIPHDVRSLRLARAQADVARAIRADLAAALAAPGVVEALDRCDHTRIVRFFRPHLLLRTALPLERTSDGPPAAGASWLTIHYSGADGHPAPRPGERRIHAGTYFTAIATGC